MIFNYTNFCH